jgi:hypothetical protein
VRIPNPGKESVEGGPAADQRERLVRRADLFEPWPRARDPRVDHGQAVFGGPPVSRLRGQAVVKPLLPDLDATKRSLPVPMLFIDVTYCL